MLRPCESLLLSRTPFDNTRFDQSPMFPYSDENSSMGLPPSLWMSPTSLSNSSSCGVLNIPTLPDTSSHRSSIVQFPISSVSASVDSKPTLFSENFTGEPFLSYSASLSPNGTTPVACAPVLQSADIDANPDKLAKGPNLLLVPIWKMYRRTKPSLPGLSRVQIMDNFARRVIALALKLKKRKEDRNKLSGESQ